MLEQALELWKRVRTWWSSLSTTRRVALLVVTASAITAVVALSWFGSQPRYVYLFTDLTSEDAAAIGGKLKELKVPFRVDPSGTALQVPEEHMHEIRLQLAGMGLPRGGGVGFELFDKSQFGATEFEQRINLRRALEGELARTVSTIASVQSARVHLVIPESSVFSARQEKASASVVLRLRQGRTFSRTEIASVVHLVTAAVPGLTPDRVSVVSADGMTLHRLKSDGATAATDDSLLEREHEMSGALEQHVTGLLERAVGPGRAEVRIHVALDPAARERTEEHFEPTKTALRSEQRVQESSNGEGASVAGVPGAQSNLPDGESEESESEGGSASRLSWTRNWEVDKVTEKTSTPAGKIARLTVAVLVDGVEREVAGKRLWQPREKPELDRYSDLIKGAIGFNEARGDLIHIESAEFAQAREAPPTIDRPVPVYRNRWFYVAVAVAAAILLLATVVLVRRRKAPNPVAIEALAGAPDTIAISAGAARPALPRALSREQSLATRDEAVGVASRDPATAAVILREWLNAPSAQPAEQARF